MSSPAAVEFVSPFFSGTSEVLILLHVARSLLPVHTSAAGARSRRCGPPLCCCCSHAFLQPLHLACFVLWWEERGGMTDVTSGLEQAELYPQRQRKYIKTRLYSSAAQPSSSALWQPDDVTTGSAHSPLLHLSLPTRSASFSRLKLSFFSPLFTPRLFVGRSEDEKQGGKSRR